MKGFVKFIFLACMTPLWSFFSSYARNDAGDVNVILIGIDGFTSYGILKSDVPNIMNLIENGSYTLTKRCVMPTRSAINWASMFMGVPTEIHGYTEWNSTSPEIPPVDKTLKNGIFPTIFQCVRDEYPESNIGVFYEWEGIKHLVDTLSLSTYQLIENPLENKEKITELACQYIQEHKPKLMALIFDGADRKGHDIGYDTDEYYQEVERIDGEIGKIISTLKDNNLYNNTIIIVTGDHGGINKDHGGITLNEIENPFIISGPHIKKNYHIDDVMMQYDIAATVADIFDVRIPKIWRGQSIYESIYDYDSNNLNRQADNWIEKSGVSYNLSGVRSNGSGNNFILFKTGSSSSNDRIVIK